MKKSIFLIVALVLVACSKDDDALRAVPASASIVNVWEMDENVYCIYLNGTVYEYDSTAVPSGEVQLQFYPDNTYNEYETGTVYDSGNYLYDGSHVTFAQGIDTIIYSSYLNPTTLILRNWQYDYSGTDTTVYLTKLKFHKI